MTDEDVLDALRAALQEALPYRVERRNSHLRVLHGGCHVANLNLLGSGTLNVFTPESARAHGHAWHAVALEDHACLEQAVAALRRLGQGHEHRCSPRGCVLSAFRSASLRETEAPWPQS